MPATQNVPGTYANRIAFYMTAAATAALIEKGRQMQAARTRQRAVRAARASMFLERRILCSDRRINHTTADMLAFAERRASERRFERTTAIDVVLP